MALAIFFGLVITFAGVALLAAHFGYLSWGLIANLGLIWSLGLLLIGLIILFRTTRYARAAGVIGVLLIFGLIISAVVYRPPLETVKISQPLESRFREARADVEFNIGRLNITATDELYLAEMTGNPRGKPRVTVSSEFLKEETSRGSRGVERAVLEFREEQLGPTLLGGLRGGHNWDLALSQRVPVDVKISGGLFRGDIDLSELFVRNIDLEFGGASTKVTLGGRSSEIKGEISAAVSNLTLRIPRNAGARLETSIIGSSNLERAGYRRVAEDVYETPNFESAEIKIDLVVDAGASIFTVEQF